MTASGGMEPQGFPSEANSLSGYGSADLRFSAFICG